MSKNKNYGLSNGYQNENKDKAPEWMDKIIETLNKPKEKKKHPFEGIDDPILNPQRIGVKEKDDK